MSSARLSAAAVRLAHSHRPSPAAIHRHSPLSRVVSASHLRLTGTLQMASAPASCPYSTDTSDVSTPRSASPSPSVDSAKSSSRTSVSKNTSQRLTYRNPMAAVDLSAIQETMKLSALDQHRGYAQDHYGEVQQDQATQYLSEGDAAGYQIIKEPFWNKGKHGHRVTVATRRLSSHLISSHRSHTSQVLPSRLRSASPRTLLASSLTPWRASRLRACAP